MEQEGLLSDDSVKLVQGHVQDCPRCRLAQLDMRRGVESAEVGLGKKTRALSPVNWIRRGLALVLRAKLLIGALSILFFLGLFTHNYSQIMVVEQYSVWDQKPVVFSMNDTWANIRDKQFEIAKYDYTSPSIEQLVRESNFRLGRRTSTGTERLTVEESIEQLRNVEGPGRLVVTLDEYTDVLIVRTGWLVWHRSEYFRVGVKVKLLEYLFEYDRFGDFNTGGIQGVLIYEDRDPGHAISLALDAGRNRQSSKIPVGISRPGRWGQ